MPVIGPTPYLGPGAEPINNTCASIQNSGSILTVMGPDGQSPIVLQGDVVGSLQTSSDGASKTKIAAGTVANTIVKGAPGRLAKVIVTASGTNAMSFYDNASTATGQPDFTIPASAVVGSIYSVGCTMLSGIVAGGNAANPGVTVTFS